MTFVIFTRTKDLFTIKTIHFRFLTTIINCFRFSNFTMTPLSNFFRRGKANSNGPKKHNKKWLLSIRAQPSAFVPCV